jgi:hypothetical protein
MSKTIVDNFSMADLRTFAKNKNIVGRSKAKNKTQMANLIIKNGYSSKDI